MRGMFPLILFSPTVPSANFTEDFHPKNQGINNRCKYFKGHGEILFFYQVQSWTPEAPIRGTCRCIYRFVVENINKKCGQNVTFLAQITLNRVETCSDRAI